MVIDFKEKFASLSSKDLEPLTQEELGYVKQVEDYIDGKIESVKEYMLNYDDKLLYRML